jgi:hypothetical protein
MDEEIKELLKTLNEDFTNKNLLNYVVKIFQKLCKDTFVYVCDKWYMYDNVWKIQKNDLRIKQFLRNKMGYVFYNHIYELCERWSECYSIKSMTFMNSVVNKLKSICCIDKFCLDADVSIFSLKNGVINEKGLFREREKGELISIATDYNFPVLNSRKRQELLLYLDSIIPLKEHRERVIKFLSLALFKKTTEIMYFNGGDSSGIACFINLIYFTFGDYVCENLSRLDKSVRINICGEIIKTGQCLNICVSNEINDISFPYNFTNEVIKDHDREKDEHIKDRLHNLRQEFFLLLLERI